MHTFQAYERETGRLGIRNHTLVLSIDAYSNTVARNVAQEVDGVVPISHQFGRGLRGEDGNVQQETLAGVGKNPNVGGVVVVGFEEDRVGTIADDIASTGKPVASETLFGQGTPLTVANAGRKAREIREGLADTPIVEASLADLFVGVECGGSDATSGVISNPLTGHMVDTVVQAGGRAAFSETLEILGTEEVLAERAASPEVAANIRQLAESYIERAVEIGIDINDSNPSPDNKKGGLTTIEEKSIGAVLKGGSTPLKGVLDYGKAPPSQSGLYFMDTPSPAQQSMTGLIAGGAQVILFSTGSGNPSGTPIAPVIKISGNPKTVDVMSDHIDVDLSGVLMGESTDADAHDSIREELLAVADGKPVAAELLGHREFGIKRVGRSIL